MSPEAPHYRSHAIPLLKSSPPTSPESQDNLPIGRKYFRGSKGMAIPGRKLILVVVFILSAFSVFRLLRIAITTSSSSPPLPALPPTIQHFCSIPLACNKVPSPTPSSQTRQKKPSTNPPSLTKKEFKLLSNLIKRQAPCNLLIFGLEPQYLKFSYINSGGVTIFLEDDPDKISSVRAKSNTTHIYKVNYQKPAKMAYKLLKHARKSPACAPNSRMLQNSTCKLASTSLPQEVYGLKWDVVVAVDGPGGHSPEAPGRMGAIYTASVIARSGNSTDVAVHDVDRTIEKWFSREFLCDENLVASMGKLWNFRITGKSNSSGFCSEAVTIAWQAPFCSVLRF